MVTTGVNAASWLQASASRMGNVSGKSSGNGSFSDMISANLSAQNRQTGSSRIPANRQAAGSADPKTGPADAVSKISGTAGGEDAGENMQPDNVGLEDDAGIDGAKLFKTGEENADSGKLETLIKGLLNSIRKAVMDTFELTEEDLVRVMEQLGMGMLDLASMQQLQQLVLAVSGETDPSAFLVNGDLAGKFSELMGKVQEIFETAGTTPEELTGFFKDRPEFTELLTKELDAADRPEEKPLVVKDAEEPEHGREAPEKQDTFQFEAVRETREEDAGAGTGSERRDDRPASAAESPAEQFLNLVADAAGREDMPVESGQVPLASQLREIADQILEKVKVIASPARTSLEITLTPESLGKVSLNIISQHGAMTARFTAQTELARQAIESQLVTLRENLEKQGLKVDAIEVTVSDFGFAQRDGASGGQPQGGKQQRRNITLSEAAGIQASSGVEEDLPPDIPVPSGNQVDYTA